MFVSLLLFQNLKIKRLSIWILFGLWHKQYLTSDLCVSQLIDDCRLHISDICLTGTDGLTVLLGPKFCDLWPLTNSDAWRLGSKDEHGRRLSISSTVRGSGLPFRYLESVLFSASSTFWCKAVEPSWALLGQRQGDKDEDEEGAGEERKGDRDVEAGVSSSLSLSGVNASISALSVETKQDAAGMDVSELAVSTPESRDSEHKFVLVSEEGTAESSSLFPSISESEHWFSSVTQASIRFPKLL